MSKSALIANNKGSALIVALVFLLILTIVGVTAMQSTSQQETMAGNMRDHSLAFQSAEAGLNYCLRLLQPPTTIPPNIPNPPGMLVRTESNSIKPEDNNDQTWTGLFAGSQSLYRNGSATAPNPPQLSGVIQDPSCIIEDMRTAPAGLTPNPCLTDTSLNCYRVTARGFGGRLETISIVQSDYYRKTAP